MFLRLKAFVVCKVKADAYKILNINCSYPILKFISPNIFVLMTHLRFLVIIIIIIIIIIK